MAYTPTADGQAVADRLAAKLEADDSTAMKDSITAGNKKPGAWADTVLEAVGVVGLDRAAALGTATSTSATYEDVGNGSSTGFGSYSFTAPIAKKYYVRVTLTVHCTTAAACLAFQLLKGGATTGVENLEAAQAICLNATSIQHTVCFTVPVTMAAGANVLKLQWKRTAGTGTLEVDGGNFRVFEVTG